MYHNNPASSKIYPGSQMGNRRRSIVFLEAVSPFYSKPNITKVAPTPEKFPSEPIKAFKNKLTFNNNNYGTIYEVLKPVLLLQRAIGIYPIGHTPSEGFKITLQYLIYSALVFLFIVGFIIYIKWYKVELMRSAEGRFEEAVIDYLFTVYLVPIIINPLAIYESRKHSDIMNEFVCFEKNYNRVVKKKMVVFLGNKPLMLTVSLPIISCVTMIVTHLTMAHFRVWQVIPYCYINLTTYLVGGVWFSYCDVVSRIAILLAEDFQHALKHTGPPSQVADYRSLWMMLAKIIRGAANAYGLTVIFLCLYLFLVITLTIYGLLSQIQEGFGVKDVGLIISALFAIALLYFICDEAHYASRCVKVEFQKRLLLVELTWMNEATQQEINMFLRATEMSQTDMSLVGFFYVNRNLFKSLLATMVTYLVVLLQFQISIPEDTGISTNSTLSPSTLSH